MKTFEQVGYKLWNSETTPFGTTKKYQRRVDTDPEFSSPLCECNERVHINIETFSYDLGTGERTTCQIGLIHENSKGEWCDLSIYSLQPDELIDNIEKYEGKILKLWEAFCS